MDKKSHRFSRFVKRISKKWLSLAKEVEKKAIAYGTKRKRHILCGHTHKVARFDGTLGYHNSGCWTDIPSHFLIIDDHGVSEYSVGENGKYAKSDCNTKE